MPITNTTTNTGCQCYECRNLGSTSLDSTSESSWCSCGEWASRRRICQEPTCMASMCEHCEEQHTHENDECADCGSRISGQPHECESCDVMVCATDYRENHDRCAYDSRDRGYMTDRPPVAGFGRNAVLDYIDEPFVSHPLATFNRAAAVELEAEYVGGGNTRALRLHDSVGITNDGSLMNGIEVTTPPAKGQTLVRFITDTITLMHDGGYSAHDQDSCGMHVHIDMRDRVNDHRFLSHLFNALFAVEDILFAMQSQRRHESGMCVPLRRDYKFYSMYGQESSSFDFNFYKAKKNRDGFRRMNYDKQEKYSSVRYAAFNFHSIYYRGSLEFRLHEGFGTPEDTLMWIEVLQHIIARVEKGHSYQWATRMVTQAVTKQKVASFIRYFELPPHLAKYVKDRVEAGQGYGLNLGYYEFGTPKRGRPRKRIVAEMPYMGRRVRCLSAYCGHEWEMNELTLYECPGCYRPLTDPSDNINYRLVRRSSRGRRRDYVDSTNQLFESRSWTFDLSNRLDIR